MKTLRFIMALALITSFAFVGTAVAADWYIAKHKSGKTVLTQKAEPGPGWTIMGGPYKTKAAAARAGNIDPQRMETQEMLKPVGKVEAPEGGYYIAKHKSGKTVITQKSEPGPGWSIIGGPYESEAEAARAGNVDPERMETQEMLKPVGKVEAAEGGYYIAKHKSGKTVITQKSEPGPGWSIIDGPYKSEAAAARAGNIDPESVTTQEMLKPVGK